MFVIFVLHYLVRYFKSIDAICQYFSVGNKNIAIYWRIAELIKKLSLDLIFGAILEISTHHSQRTPIIAAMQTLFLLFEIILRKIDRKKTPHYACPSSFSVKNIFFCGTT